MNDGLYQFVIHADIVPSDLVALCSTNKQLRSILQYNIFLLNNIRKNLKNYLRRSMAGNYIDSIEHLLSLGLNINDVRSFDNYVIQYAPAYGHTKIVKYLKSAIKSMTVK